MLFVKLAEGASLDEALAARIRAVIVENATPRHVPAKILGDMARTKSGKIVELAVRAVVHGEPVANAEALANPSRFRKTSGQRHGWHCRRSTAKSNGRWGVG